MQNYVNKTKHRNLFETKTGHKLEILSPETMELLGNTKKGMLIKIAMERMCQNQNLLKYF